MAEKVPPIPIDMSTQEVKPASQIATEVATQAQNVEGTNVTFNTASTNGTPLHPGVTQGGNNLLEN